MRMRGAYSAVVPLIPSAYGAGCMVRVTGLAVKTGGAVNTERETESVVTCNFVHILPIYHAN